MGMIARADYHGDPCPFIYAFHALHIRVRELIGFQRIIRVPGFGRIHQVSPDLQPPSDFMGFQVHLHRTLPVYVTPHLDRDETSVGRRGLFLYKD
jgi:hypothetical protein